MSDQKDSIALSKMKIRLSKLDEIRVSIGMAESLIKTQEDNTKRLKNKLCELKEDEKHCAHRIEKLIEEAADEGLSQDKINKVLDKHRFYRK